MRFSSTNPATGQTLWTGDAATLDQVAATSESSRQSFGIWRNVSVEERKEVLAKYADVCKKHLTALAASVRDEAGKVQSDAESEAAAVVGKVAATISAFDRRRNEQSFDMGGTGGATARTSYRPIGVLAVLGPFNFPCHLPNGHIVPAILAGNTVIFKPSELTPRCGELLGELWAEAGLPEGVLTILQGGREVGEALASADIDGLLFTGGSKAGMALHKHFADRPDKMLALELGGNNPLVVHNVQDTDAAINAILNSAYISSGQRCTCARRLILTSDVTRDLIDKLQSAVTALKVGMPTDDPSPFMGPLINANAAKNVLDAQAQLITRGGKALVECKPLDLGNAFISPGLIDMTDARREDEEIFGPLLQLTRVDSLDDAIVEANNTRFGLAAGILCDDRADYERFARNVKAGIINWNRQLTGASGQLPFGGVGFSGNFRPSGSFAIDYCSYAVASIEEEPPRRAQRARS